MLPPPTPPTALRYQPELMGLRAVAIGLVVLGHWTLAYFPLSEVGRLPLFVLSGYLISGIIWKNDIYWGVSAGWTRRLGIFYTRRFLRIIPPYYVSLALGALLPLATLHEHPGWFVLPLSNVLSYQLRRWPEGVGHYWTMAVEEQFYLLWPLLLGLMRKWRVVGLWLLVGLGLASRVYGVLYVVPASPVFATVLLPACLDLFAIGALLRLHTATARARPTEAPPYPGWPAAAVGIMWCLLWGFTRNSEVAERAWNALAPGLGALVSYLALRWLMRSPRQARWLAHPLAQWLGKRSYGMYLYHLMLPVFYQRLVFHLLPAASPWRQWWLTPLPTVLVLGPILIGMSAASWHWLEAPLERLKTRFAYQSEPATSTPTQRKEPVPGKLPA